MAHGGAGRGGSSYSMWVRNMAEAPPCERGGGERESANGGVGVGGGGKVGGLAGEGKDASSGGISFDLSSAFKLSRPVPVHLERGELKAICLL